MAPRPWSEWSTTLSHLALGVVSLHAAVSTAQVSTLGLGRGVSHSGTVSTCIRSRCPDQGDGGGRLSLRARVA